MEHDDMVEALRDAMTSWDRIDVSFVRRVEAAAAEQPQSAGLQDLLGDALSVWERAEIGWKDRARRAYERATELEPAAVEYWTSLGAFLDVHAEELAGARAALERAAELGGSAASYSLLARVMTEMGERERAIELLEGCAFAAEPGVMERREEIERGEWEPL